MGSLSSSDKIPIIDLSTHELRPGTDSWGSVRSQVHQALQSYGCFEAVLGEAELKRDMVAAMKQLFDLPLETRLKQPPSDRYNGRPNPHTPLYANMGISDVQDPDCIPNFTKVMWPHGNSKFCEAMSSFAILATQMEQTVRRMVFESFGVESYYDSLAECSSYFLRLNRYRTPKKDETNLGLNVHTDSCFLSVLAQNEMNGLQIQTKDGRWISVNPSPSSFTVLVGDAMMAWSNGRLHAPPHRVLMNSDKMRYSMAMFAFIKGKMIQTPEELVDEEHPQLFKPFDHMGYRRFITSGEGLEHEFPIKAYCGV